MYKLKKIVGICVILFSCFTLTLESQAQSQTGGGFMMVEPNSQPYPPTNETEPPEVENPGSSHLEGGLPQTGETKQAVLLVIGSVLLIIAAMLFALNKIRNRRD